MASSSSNPSSTSSSTTSNPSAARPNRPPRFVFPARALPEEDWPELGTRAAAPRTRAAAPLTNPARAHRRGGRSRNTLPRNSGVSQHVPPSVESGWENAADPTSTFAPVMWSAEEGSSSSAASAWSEPFPSSSTVASTPTDTTTASAATSSTTPSRDSALVPSASGSAPAVATSAHTPSTPGVKKISDLALQPHALTSASTSSPKIVDASTPSSAPGVTAIPDPSATTSAPTIPSLRDNWVALHWGIVPRPVEHCPGQRQAFGGNGMPPVEVVYPDPLCPWREHGPPRSLGGPRCWDCGDRPVRLVARPCGHLDVCVQCYCDWYRDDSTNWFVCPCCGSPITWLLWR